MKVIVGLSGGVDSSVAAMILLNQGYQVEALFMKNWEEDDTDGCSAAQDLQDAKDVASRLGIKLHTVNFATEYWEDVWQNFIDEHKRGRTPNPDVLCNQKIKFKVFLEYALSLGADKIATGHYANVLNQGESYYLTTAKDSNKDQTYFLHLLNNYQLSKSIFPLGGLLKNQVREIAKQNNLITYNKKDSTGICFIGEKQFSLFLANYIKEQQGDIVDDKGNFIKKHQGVAFYTIGQRKGLGIGGGFGDGSNNPWFVVDKEIKNNKLIVAQGDSDLLYHDVIITEKPHFINDDIDYNNNYSAKIRHRGKLHKCRISAIKDGLEVKFTDKFRAITPGQSVVFYNKNICLGGAIIKTRLNSVS